MAGYSVKAVVMIAFMGGILVQGKIKSSSSGPRKSLDKEGNLTVSTDSLKQLISQVDSTGVLERLIMRKLHVPKHSSLTFTSQVSRPNIFPNLFRQPEGFIVDAVLEWPIWLDLHKFANAMYDFHEHDDGDRDRTGLTDEDEDDDREEDEEEEFESSRMSVAGIVGVERCLIYEKVESGMSLYLDIGRNQSRDCVLRAICEAQMIADYYPDAPSSVFFEVLHLILKPSLGTKDACYEDYLGAEEAADQGPLFCSNFVAKCPLNIAGLFVRNFFPDFEQGFSS